MKLLRNILQIARREAPAKKARVAATESLDGIGAAHALQQPLTGEGVVDDSHVGLSAFVDAAAVLGAKAENRRLEALVTVCRRCVDVPWSVVRSESGPYGHVNEVALRLELLIDAAASRRRPLHSSQGNHPEVL